MTAAAPLLAAPVVPCPGLACLACGGPLGCQRLHATAWAWIHLGARPPSCPGLLVPPGFEVNYLLHFTPPYRHAGHYLGFAECSGLLNRLRKQATGRGANLVAVALAAGCTFELVWLRPGTRDDERRRKNLKAAPRLLCPVCPARPARAAPREFRIPDAAQGVLALAEGGG
jgi:hypothetical protein